MILQNWQNWPDAPALEWEHGQITYAELAERVDTVSDWLKNAGVQRIALLADNHPDWVILDLACQLASVVLIPIPPYFSAQQQQHLLEQAGVDFIATDSPERFEQLEICPGPFDYLVTCQRETNLTPVIPEGTGKITFTSGSTGNPKGVCLSNASQQVVAQSLVDALQFPSVRHVCLLPLATLLENIAGVYAPLLNGGTVVLPNSVNRGFTGASLGNPQALLSMLHTQSPETLILVPELLELLVTATNQGWPAPASLKFVAVGGAHVSPTLLQHARDAGFPVYQGYGLSECVSVNTLNTPQADRIDSVGTALGHNCLSIENGELVVSGAVFLGYLNSPETFYPKRVKTGDLVSEKDGFYYVSGRKKNIIITSLGRNISPEWIETALRTSGLFSQVMVVGEARAECGALLVPRNLQISDEAIEKSIEKINQALPEYARIRVWRSLSAFPSDAGLFSANGKLKRQQAIKHFQRDINQMYAPELT